ncbi:MAG: outer membrane lipoprotein-sorting protein [Pseudomonadota bacterium]
MSMVLQHKLRKALNTGLLVVMSIASQAALSLSLEEQGFEIAAHSDRSDRGFSDSRVELKMILRNAAGKEATRKLTITTLEIPDESVGDKSLIIFHTPPDIDGTALLSHAQILEPDAQWLYLPSLKRTKRISSVNKSGPFVGSEFAFEDLTALELNKYDYKYLRSEPCGALQCDIVERYPLYQHSGYSKQIIWVDQDVYQIRKTEFYDRRGDLLKTLEMNEYRVYTDKFWRPHHFSMVNHQTGKSTELLYSDYNFGNDLNNRDFIKNVLKRTR